MSKNTIVITGGGTGGHLSIAKIIAQEYNKIGIKPIYIGSTKGQDRAWFENSPLFSQTIFFDSYGVVNQGFFGKIKSLSNILKLSFQTKKILKDSGVKKVFSVGGYSASVASFAAIMSRIPLFVHEQNAVMGRLNKVLKPFSKEVFCSYDPSSKVKDYPVDERWFDIQKEHNDIKTIAFLGGSQGAKFINNLALDSALWLKEKGIKIIHQTGRDEYEKIVNFYKNNKIEAEVFEFFSPLYEKLKDVDLCVSRSGAGSVWELCAARIPTLFIPFPYAAANHQYHNAKTLHCKGACLIVNQKEMDKDVLIKMVENIDIKSINDSLIGIIKKDGAKEIIEIIEKG